MATRTHTDTQANVRTRLPLFKRWSTIAQIGQQTVELTLVWTTRAHWRRIKPAGETWGEASLGGFVIAFRLRG